LCSVTAKGKACGNLSENFILLPSCFDMLC
jgi:hypothetical protein